MLRLILSLLALSMATTAYAQKPTLRPSSKAVNLKAARGKTAVKPIKLSCIVDGTPAESPNDLMIKNEGQTSVKKGTILVWKTKGEKGRYALKDLLEPGKALSLNNVLKKSLKAGSKCMISLQSKARRSTPSARPRNPRVFKK